MGLTNHAWRFYELVKLFCLERTGKNSMRRARLLILGVIVGCAITSLPWLVSKLNYEALWPINFLDLPDGIVAVLLSGNVHTYSLSVLLVGNVGFYACLTYLSFRNKAELDRENPVTKSPQ